MTIRFQVGFNRIVIVESKETTEPNNGLEIYQRHSKRWETQGIASQYHVVDSVTEVVALIESLVDSVTTEGVPVLHLDMHGRHSGLELSNGGEVSWDLLRHPLSRLNSACNGRLVIVVGACHGANMWKTLLGDGAPPFFAYVGLPDKVRSLDLCDAMHAFYNQLIGTGSFNVATEMANRMLRQRGQPILDTVTAFALLVGAAKDHLSRYYHRQAMRIHASAMHNAFQSNDFRETKLPRLSLADIRQRIRFTAKPLLAQILAEKFGIETMPNSPIAAHASRFLESIGPMPRKKKGKSFRRRYLANVRQGIWPRLGTNRQFLLDEIAELQ